MENEMQTIEKILGIIIDFFVNYSFQVVAAVLILVAGFIVARSAASFMMKLFDKKSFDPTLSKFTTSTLKITIISFAVIIALGKFGITIAPFIAALAAMAFGASFAIQGPLSNYGAGLVIVLTRPFVVGNTITIAGTSGVVEEIKLDATILTDEDGVTITIPNKHIVGEILHNSEQRKTVEEIVGISYGSNPEKAIRIVKEALDGFDEIAKDPGPQVGIQEFGDSSINIGFRYWVPTKSYFQTLYRVNSAIYKGLKEGSIDIPFPQVDVHVVSSSGQSLSPA